MIIWSYTILNFWRIGTMHIAFFVVVCEYIAALHSAFLGKCKYATEDKSEI